MGAPIKLRSGYSFRVAFGHLPEVIARIDTPYAPITDRASTFGFNRWTKLCKANNKKPIYGIELAVVPSINEKKLTRNYMTFIARESLAPLHQLLERATSQFRYEPLLTYEDLKNVDSSIAVLIGKNPIKELLTNPIPDQMFLDISPSTVRPLLTWAINHCFACVLSSDNYYPAPDDRAAYQVLTGRGALSQSWAQHILTQEEHKLNCKRIGIEFELVKNCTDYLANSCKAELIPGILLKPEKTKTLRQLCEEGAVRLDCDLIRPEYAARLEKELNLIEEKKFEDYFFIIADLMTYSKKHMLCGPARGSSAGSLVCYLLGITTIDPIPFGLLFERFISAQRAELPDIDEDFSDQHRHLAIEYLENKYGREHVARLGTVAVYKPKSAINETAGALNIPKWKIDAFTNSIVERSGGDSRALQAIEDTFKDTDSGRQLLAEFPELIIAQRLEGHPRHYSQHASGIVVTQSPVKNYVGIDVRTMSTHCDKKDAEDLNLLKIDMLGLTQLSIFEDCLKAIDKPHSWLINYPLDDQKAFDVLNRGKWSGIFQWNGHALQSLTQQIKIENFNDIAAITALARPGPLMSGGATIWVDRKNKKTAVDYPHPLLKPYLESSLGIVMFQEQVMQIGKEIGNLSWEDVTALRQAMSKSLGKEFFDKFGDKFKLGAKEKGIPEDIRNKFWNDMCQFGAWGYNLSHAVAYGMVSYWCCVLKAHYPAEFAAASLTHEKDPDKQLKLLRELAAEGMSYKAIDIDHSTDRWQSVNGQLIGPLQNVKGIGPKLLNEILHARANRLPMPKRALKLLADPKTTVDELYPVSAKVRQLVPDLKEFGIVTPITPLEKIKINNGEENFVVVAKVAELNPRDHNELGNIVKRGYKMTGQTLFLNLVLEDDTDRILARVNRYDYAKVGKPIVEIGDAGNALYVMKGKLAKNFRLLNIERARLIGKMK